MHLWAAAGEEVGQLILTALKSQRGHTSQVMLWSQQSQLMSSCPWNHSWISLWAPSRESLAWTTFLQISSSTHHETEEKIYRLLQASTQDVTCGEWIIRFLNTLEVNEVKQQTTCWRGCWNLLWLCRPGPQLGLYVPPWCVRCERHCGLPTPKQKQTDTCKKKDWGGMLGMSYALTKSCKS